MVEIPVSELKNRGINITGIIHVGAGRDPECEIYRRTFNGPVVWFEPLPQTIEFIKKRVESTPNNTLIEVAIADIAGHKDFFVTSNGDSSSFRRLKEHLKFSPKVRPNGKIRVECRPLDYYIGKFNNCNVLVVDVQGGEDLVLKGAKETLQQIEGAIIEVNDIEVYEGNPSVQMIDEMMSEAGFKRVMKKRINPGQSDAMYIR